MRVERVIGLNEIYIVSAIVDDDLEQLKSTKDFNEAMTFFKEKFSNLLDCIS